MPDTYEGLQRIGQAIGTDQENEVLAREFVAFKSESIDYGIMEKASNIYILTSAFGWDDVGSWLAVGRIKKTNDLGNIVSGNAITVDTKKRRKFIQGEKKKPIATVGLENMIIVDTSDALLVCEKDHAGDIKKVLENLQESATGQNTSEMESKMVSSLSIYGGDNRD